VGPFCGALFAPDDDETSVVWAVRPTGLSTIVNRLGVLTVVFFRSRLTVLKRTRSIDSRGELIRLLSEPVKLASVTGKHGDNQHTSRRMYTTPSLQNRIQPQQGNIQ
jgi:hypothetical protein